MTDRTGWHCTACNRYFQSPTAAPDPRACRYCGESGSLRRIDHGHAAVDVAVGDVVGCDIISETREYVVGEVVEVLDDRLVVDAHDGSGRYTVTPEQVVERRGAG